MSEQPADGGLVVRSATLDDLPRLVEILELGALSPGTEDARDLEPYRRALREIADGPGDVLVAQLDGTVVGVCQLVVFRHLQAHGGRCGEVESVHVHPDWRGQGIGHRLVGEAVERAQEAGCYRVQLTSNAARTEAHRFYESLGFVASHVGFKLLLP